MDREATRIVDRGGGSTFPTVLSTEGPGRFVNALSTSCARLRAQLDQFDGISSSIPIHFRSSSFQARYISGREDGIERRNISRLMISIFLLKLL